MKSVVVSCVLSASVAVFLLPTWADGIVSVRQALDEFSTNHAASAGMALAYVKNASSNAASEQVSREALSALRTMARMDGAVSVFDEHCKALMKSPAEHIRYTAGIAYSGSPTVQESPEDIAGALRELAGPNGRLNDVRKAEIAKTAADIYANWGVDVDTAIAVLDECGATVGDVAVKCGLMMRAIEVLRRVRHDDAAILRCKNLFKVQDCPQSTYVSATYALVEMLSKMDRGSEAGDALVQAFERDPMVPSGFARALVSGCVSTNVVRQIVDRSRERIAAIPLSNASAFQSAMERAQPEIVDMLVYCGCLDEALAECRVLIFTATPGAYESAVVKAADIIRHRDGHLGNAMNFLEYYKKGIVPTGENPILSVPQLNDRTRRRAREALRGFVTRDWSEQLSVSHRYIWLDDPKAAVRAAARAFSMAPFSDRNLQQCADAIMRPLLDATRDPDIGKATVEYLLRGGNGPDGIKGTGDDVRNPIEMADAVLNLKAGKTE